MNRSKITFLIGVLAGAASFAVCLADIEIVQYILAFVSIAAFALSDRLEQKRNIMP